jgi:UDP-N-acetylmuramoyl-L-alanyl-D-glutamate--2,6-diaminopimelate ligase
MSSRNCGKDDDYWGKSKFDVHILDRLGVGISRLVTDSRLVKPGDTFLAYSGESVDGRKYIRDAVAAGANAVVWDCDGYVWDPALKIPNLPLSGLRARAGIIADQVYSHPSQKLSLIGITGTNGKTSCSHWIAQAMTAAGGKTAVIGTLGMGFPDELEQTINTTPDTVLLHAKIADFLRRGASCVAMEVSSHGIVQGRINGAAFAVAMLTNLSRDHLDYHGCMESYAAAKSRLFHWPGLKYAVLNLDDPFGASMARDLEGTDTQIIGYGFNEHKFEARDSEKFCVLRGRNLQAARSGLEFDIEFEGVYSRCKTEVMGAFNASNLLGVLGVLLANGVEFSDAVRALYPIRPVAGRMQQIGGGDAPLVLIDYAHTPDAMEKVLTALREIADAGSVSTGSVQGGDEVSGKLICVFGCGGERDAGKRALMGEVATRLADEVILTSDNSRSEDPEVIIGDIAAGAAANYCIEKDRAAAIRRAIIGARKGDVILIAGKGHETYQEIGGKKLPFSDIEVAKGALLAETVEAP